MEKVFRLVSIIWITDIILIVTGYLIGLVYHYALYDNYAAAMESYHLDLFGNLDLIIMAITGGVISQHVTFKTYLTNRGMYPSKKLEHAALFFVKTVIGALVINALYIVSGSITGRNDFAGNDWTLLMMAISSLGIIGIGASMVVVGVPVLNSVTDYFTKLAEN